MAEKKRPSKNITILPTKSPNTHGAVPPSMPQKPGLKGGGNKGGSGKGKPKK
jgi:hypothetical protein